MLCVFFFSVYPQVTKDPVNRTVIEGDSVRMECEFSGSPKPSITWEKDTESLSDGKDASITLSGNTSILNIRSAVGENSGTYRCVAKLKHITERTKEATLFVKGEHLIFSYWDHIHGWSLV